ncbi:MAG: hypothetical protein F4227_05110 [Gammaproteobacteria bacterium]|nr:hypothetical protein [Gammaproteobacteria bacterium]MYI77457.1 hypothetical protein [Gammaproteobacteria bacterium]
MTITVNMKPEKNFTGISHSGYAVSLQAPDLFDFPRQGIASKDLILMGLGSCCTVSAIHILHKSKVDITECRTQVTTIPEESDLIDLSAIHLHFDLTGHQLTESTIDRALKLGTEKYCVVSNILCRAGIDITHTFALHCASSDQPNTVESSSTTLETQGLHHVALTSTNFEASREFYAEIMKMQVEWEPDTDNVYLTNGNDNLAIHRGNPKDSKLDHIGFILNSEEEVDQWYSYLCTKGVQIAKEPKTHRDGARSFYVYDPDGVSVQLIYHPPLSKQVLNS